MTSTSKLRRFWAFFKQLIFWTPIAFFTNVCAVGPIYLIIQAFNGDDSFEPLNLIFIAPIMFAIAFALSKFRQVIKGRKTDEYYDAYYDEVTTYYLGDEKIGESHRDVVRTEHSNTFWGNVGIVLSFVAFPLQLVALTASFLSLFFPVIYSTSRKLPENRHFSFGNVILHTLFDFVIIPCHVQKKNLASTKGFLWLPFYISIPIVDLLVFALIGSALGSLFEIQAIGIISLLAFFVTLISIIVMIIKYTALIVYSCSKQEGLTYGARIGRTSILAGVLFVVSLMFM